MKYITGLKRTGKSGIYRMQFRYKNHRINQTTATANRGKAITVILKKKFDLMRITGSDEGFQRSDMSFIDAGFLAFGIHFYFNRSASAIAYQLQALDELIGDHKVSDIKRSTFAFIEREFRLRGCSANTINKYYSTINVTLETVRKNYDAPCASTHKVKLKINMSHVRSISRSEDLDIHSWINNPKTLVRSLAGWTSQDLIDIYEVGIRTGMRRGEIFGFRVDQIRGQTINLEPEQHKTGDTRGTKTIILSKEAVKIIDCRIKRLGLNGKDKVFPYSKDAFTRLWRRMKKDLGLSEDRLFTPHCMRHTFATHMAEKGLPIYQLSKMLGHTTVKTTEMYAHLFNDELVAAMNKYS